MGTFKTKYNYIIFSLRVLLLLFFIALFIGFIFYSVPKFIHEWKYTFKLILGMVAAAFLIIFLCYCFLKLLIRQRNIISFEDDYLKINDAILKKQRLVYKNDIKGFSLTTYPTRIWDFKEILIYFSNGEKIGLPQFLYWNFKNIKPEFELHGLKFLGTERFRWKFLDSRYYQFD